MPPLPSRKALEAMKRVDLQRLCKDYGVKANLKSDALIDLLLDTQSAHPRQQQETQRVVSTRRSGRSGPSRISSVIIHDTDDEGDGEEEGEAEDHHLDSFHPGTPARDPTPSSKPPPRTRKAKELQTKLGVGRPIAAGGSGPRAVTKSFNIPRGKRARSSKVIKPSEATIEEEPEPAPDLTQDEIDINGSSLEALKEKGHSPRANTSDQALLARSDVDKLISDALRRFSEEIHTIKCDLQEVQKLKSEVAHLKEKLSLFDDMQLKVDSLTMELLELRSQAHTTTDVISELEKFKESLACPRTPQPSTPKSKTAALPDIPATPRLPSVSHHPRIPVHQTASSSQTILPHPGAAPSLLGKRHRDSVASNITGVLEEGQGSDLSDSELARTVLRPTKKRPKLGRAASDTDRNQTAATSSSNNGADIEDTGAEGLQPPIQRVPSFTVFQGPDEPDQYLDPGPPMSHLPDFFAPPSPPAASPFPVASRAQTTSASASENQQPFTFSFLPMTSTPANEIFMPSFPYPEPPQSPSPAGSSTAPFPNHAQDERTDIFKSFGFPSPTRSSRLSGASASGSQSQQQEFINPAALANRPEASTSRSKEREVSSNEIAAGLGLSILPTAEPDNNTDALPMKRTMYGTELEGDTRFGDFGVTGVATGFWSSSTGPRF
ncbi:hypothetical protein BDQ12DRAFT_710878 [Crucibulum laeve]|uniref:Uncharacterized protein n=1 Tax=Crucibulum laeve TaxID=68775 RepID=A0A5C3MB63_9AGAR|nr:hypothetical protein BDQ12DRAFT_710878 [Crucibulum laeve]